MVLTKEELIASLQNEVRILVHLAGKVDTSKLDYRPTPKQRSTLELLQYMADHGPDPDGYHQNGNVRSGCSECGLAAGGSRPRRAMNFDQAVAAIEKQSDEYARVLRRLDRG